MLTFLFWNIQKKPLLHRVARLTGRHTVDVLILVECAADPAEVLTSLNGSGGLVWQYPPSFATKVRLFTRLPATSLIELFNDASGRLTIREVRPSDGSPFLLAGVHLPSKFG